MKDRRGAAMRTFAAQASPDCGWPTGRLPFRRRYRAGRRPAFERRIRLTGTGQIALLFSEREFGSGRISTRNGKKFKFGVKLSTSPVATMMDSSAFNAARVLVMRTRATVPFLDIVPIKKYKVWVWKLCQRGVFATGKTQSRKKCIKDGYL
jgi:hypothetical protein